VGQPEVLVTGTRRPGRRQLKLTAVDENAVRDHAQRDLVVGTEQTGASQVAATRVSGRTLAVVEETAEVIARTGPGRLDVDARQHRPAPLVIRMTALRGARLGASASRTARAWNSRDSVRPLGRARVQRCLNAKRIVVVGGVDLVEVRRHPEPAPGLIDREVDERIGMLEGTERGG